MASRRGSGVAAAAATIALAVGGCGGSDDDRLSRGDLIRRANGICKRHDENIAAAARGLSLKGRTPIRRRLRRFVHAVFVPEYTAQIRELRRLKPPDELADAYEKWLADSEAATAKIARNPLLLLSATIFRTADPEAFKLGLSGHCYHRARSKSAHTTTSGAAGTGHGARTPRLVSRR